MKILRLTAMALAASVGGIMGCASACGGTNTNTNTNTPAISCGAGTTQVNGVCQLNGKTTTQ
ncbi:MAG: hypothetical protein ACHQ49_04215 [Elusimicrobiota bacterium]